MDSAERNGSPETRALLDDMDFARWRLPDGSMLWEREASVSALRELAARNGGNTQALRELRIAHAAMLREREASASMLRELGARTEWNTRALAELRGAHQALRGEHEATLSELRELRERYDAVLQDRRRPSA